MAMSHMAPGWVTCHPFNEAFASAGKGPISPDRAIGHNGEQILIFEIAVAAKRRELAAPMPSLTDHQTNWAIENSMIWIKSLIRRM